MNWCCFGCIFCGVERFLHSEMVCFVVVLMVLTGFFTVNWCALVVFVVLRGFLTVNWSVLVVLMALIV